MSQPFKPTTPPSLTEAEMLDAGLRRSVGYLPPGETVDSLHTPLG